MATATLSRKTAARFPASRFALAKRRAAKWCEAAERERLDIINRGEDFFALIEVGMNSRGETSHATLEIRGCMPGEDRHGELLAEAAVKNRQAQECDMACTYIVCRVGVFYDE